MNTIQLYWCDRCEQVVNVTTDCENSLGVECSLCHSDFYLEEI